eukprot:scaffold3319_cov427-Prasinococcus_capsulatus_cf.AAC.3
MQGRAEPIVTLQVKGKRGLGHGDTLAAASGDTERHRKKQKQGATSSIRQQEAIDERREALLLQLRQERRKAEEEDARVKGISRYIYNSFRDDYDSEAMVTARRKEAMSPSARNPLQDWGID